MVDNINHIVQEGNIVWNKDKGILIVLEIALKPINMLSIQVVGRLVQQQDIRLFKEKFSQKHLGSLTTWQRSYIRIHAKVHDTKGTRHFINLSIQGIKITTLQTVLKFTNFFHKSINIRSIFSHFHIEVIDTGFCFEKLIKGCTENITHWLSFFQDRVLIQVTSSHILWPLNLPFIW